MLENLKINPFNQGNPMTLKDAAVVATLTALVIWILTFFANATIGAIRADPVAFCFDAIRTYAISWAGTFMTLAGLEQYMKQKET